MDEDNYGFGDEFGDPDAFFEETTDLPAGDDTDFAFTDGVDGDGHRAGHCSGVRDVGDDDLDMVPPEIEDVQQYFPNVTPKAFPVTVGVLAQADLGIGVDLRELSCATRNVEYMPSSRNACATMRLHEPRAVVLVRNSGSLAVIGAASISEARQAVELAARIVRKALNLNFDAIRFRVRSLMARFNVCSPIRLDDLAHHNFDARESPGVGGVFCSYEPERFNGCTVRLTGQSRSNQWSVSCMVFVTGKITMMGARSPDELRFAFDAMVPIVAKYTGATNVWPSGAEGPL